MSRPAIDEPVRMRSAQRCAACDSRLLAILENPIRWCCDNRDCPARKTPGDAR